MARPRTFRGNVPTMGARGARERAVFKGNGHPSLVSRAEATDISLAHLKEDIAAIKGNQGWAVRLIIGQIVMYALSALWKVLPMLSK